MSSTILAWVLASLVLVFAVRRYVLVAASFWAPARLQRISSRTVLLIASARNEAGRLPAFLDSLDKLRYDPGALRIVLVDDASEDATPSAFEAWVSSRPHASCISLPSRRGKAEALNTALRVVKDHSELVAVYDADVLPNPDALQFLAAPFDDPAVAAVSGYRRPMRPDDNRVTRFAALESWVHQLVSQCGKDVLGWNPTTLGAHCIYRRSALLETGGFTPGAFSEDIEVSLSLVGAGWRTRFVRDAIAGSEVPVSLAQFWNQRSRWTRGLYASGRKASGVETILVASGYLDRLVFLAVCIMASCGALSPLWPLLHLSGPSITVFAALCHAKVGQRTTSYLASAIQMFVLDIAVTASATVSAVLRRPLSWRGSSANGPR